jgi:hypothetical protein
MRDKQRESDEKWHGQGQKEHEKCGHSSSAQPMQRKESTNQTLKLKTRARTRTRDQGVDTFGVRRSSRATRRCADAARSAGPTSGAASGSRQQQRHRYHSKRKRRQRQRRKKRRKRKRRRAWATAHRASRASAGRWSRRATHRRRDRPQSRRLKSDETRVKTIRCQ